MNTKEEIIEAEFSVVEDEGADNTHESHFWVLVGNNLIDAKLVKISTKAYSDYYDVDCYVSQVEGVEIKNPLDFKVSKKFGETPTKEKQKEMVKTALLQHQLTGEFCQVGEQYVHGHLRALQIQKSIKGGAR